MHARTHSHTHARLVSCSPRVNRWPSHTSVSSSGPGSAHITISQLAPWPTFDVVQHQLLSVVFSFSVWHVWVVCRAVIWPAPPLPRYTAVDGRDTNTDDEWKRHEVTKTPRQCTYVRHFNSKFYSRAKVRSNKSNIYQPRHNSRALTRRFHMVCLRSQGFTGPQIWSHWPQNVGLDPKISNPGVRSDSKNLRTNSSINHTFMW